MRRRFQYPSRKRFLADRACENQRADHPRKQRDRIVVATGSRCTRNQPRHQLEHLFERLGEGGTNSLGLAGDVRAERSDHTAIPG